MSIERTFSGIFDTLQEGVAYRTAFWNKPHQRWNDISREHSSTPLYHHLLFLKYIMDTIFLLLLSIFSVALIFWDGCASSLQTPPARVFSFSQHAYGRTAVGYFEQHFPGGIIPIKRSTRKEGETTQQCRTWARRIHDVFLPFTIPFAWASVFFFCRLYGLDRLRALDDIMMDVFFDTL